MRTLEEIKEGLETLPRVEEIDNLIKAEKIQSHEEVAEKLTDYLNDFGEFIHHEENSEHNAMELINQSGIINILKDKGYTVLIEEEGDDYSIGVDW